MILTFVVLKDLGTAVDPLGRHGINDDFERNDV